MSRYINTDETIAQIRSDYKNLDAPREWSKGINFAISRILQQPTADVRENVHGEWVTVKGSNGKDYRKCTNCLHIQEITGLLNFCPICGADMRGRKLDKGNEQ